MNIQENLQQFAEKINENPEHIQGFQRRYHFQLKSEGSYELLFSDGQVEVNDELQTEEADCSLQMSEKNLGKLIQGDLDPTKAFMTGQIKVQGKVGHALKLHSIVKKYQSS